MSKVRKHLAPVSTIKQEAMRDSKSTNPITVEFLNDEEFGLRDNVIPYDLYTDQLCHMVLYIFPILVAFNYY